MEYYQSHIMLSVSHNIVSLTKHCYEYEKLYVQHVKNID
jgi:hypothetical protein